MTRRLGRTGIETAVRAQCAAEVMAERARHAGGSGTKVAIRRVLARLAKRINNPEPKE